MDLLHLAIRILAALNVFAKWAFALIIIGVASQLLSHHDVRRNGPRGRLIFTVCWAALASLISFISLVSFYWTWATVHYPLDILISIGFFSAFAALQTWLQNDQHMNCRRAFRSHRGFSWQNQCDLYKVAEASAFISGTLWLFHAFLSCFLFHFWRKRIQTRRAERQKVETVPTGRREVYK